MSYDFKMKGRGTASWLMVWFPSTLFIRYILLLHSIIVPQRPHFDSSLDLELELGGATDGRTNGRLEAVT